MGILKTPRGQETMYGEDEEHCLHCCTVTCIAVFISLKKAFLSVPFSFCQKFFYIFFYNFR